MPAGGFRAVIETNRPARSAFTFRFLDSGEAEKDILAATERAEDAAKGWLTERSYDYKDLRSQAEGLSQAPPGKRQRRAAGWKNGRSRNTGPERSFPGPRCFSPLARGKPRAGSLPAETPHQRDSTALALAHAPDARPASAAPGQTTAALRQLASLLLDYSISC